MTQTVIDESRRAFSMVRTGVVLEVDAVKAKVKVKLKESHSPWLPWLVQAAGSNLKSWRVPTKGEVVLIFAPEGDLNQGVVMAGLYAEDNTAPSTNPDLVSLVFGDGTVFSYDQKSHNLVLQLQESGQTTLTTEGGLNIIGDVTITGDLGATGDVSDGERSIKAFYSEYESHKHQVIKEGQPTGTPQ